MKRSFGIRGILSLLVVVLMAPVFVAVIHASVKEQGHALEQARDTLRRETQLRADSQRQLFEGVRAMLIAIAHTVESIADQPAACERYLKGINAHFDQYINLALADADGDLRCRSADIQTRINVADRSYFKGAMASGKFTVGEYLVARLFLRPALVLSLPLVTDRGRKGVLYATLELSTIQKGFAAAASQLDLTELLTDASGVVLAAAGNNAPASGKLIPDPRLLELVHDQTTALDPYSEGTKDEWLYDMERVRAEGAGSVIVVTMARTSDVLAPTLARLRTEIGALLLITLVACLVAWRIGDRLIASPVERLRAKVKALGQGDAGALEQLPQAGSPVRELAQIDLGLQELASELARRSAQREAAIADLRRQKEELEDSEARYRAQFESSPQPMWVFDQDTLSFLVVNDAAVAHYGYTREEFLAMTIADIRPPEDVAELRRSLAARRHERTNEVPGRQRLKSGEIIHVQLASHRVQWQGHDARMVIAYDITARVVAEQAWKHLHETLEREVAQRTRELELAKSGLELANHDLEIANHELEAFSYSVSHDLKAPVNIIDGFCQALLQRHRDELSAQAAHYLERIRANAERMDALIGDLLALSRSGREPLVRRRLDLARIVDEITDDMRQRFPYREVSVTMDRPLTALADERMMRIVLENLIGNAWKFTAQAQRASIHVGSIATDQGPNAIVVSDNGAGFDPAQASELFKPFRRLHSTSEFPGSGIGLAIVHRIVRRHGGHVWAESAPGQGARFFLVLPDLPDGLIGT